ncbi:A24 family peptidase [Actinomadura meridiana]|uniref:A24 family peptidase n=1 Tax=Actinomadura meridiana TaxID=559626 RepID=UPI0031EA4A1B
MGFAVGLLLTPLAAPFVEDVSRRHRMATALLTAVTFSLLGWRVGPEPVLPALLYLAAAATLLGFIDIKTKRLPDRFTLPSYAAVALLAAAAPFSDNGPERLLHALIGMVALFALFFLQAFFVPSGIGMGDVKLSGVLGLYLGWFGRDTWILGLLTTYLLGALAGITIMIVRRTRKGEFPFGPAMLAGTLIAVLASTS